MQYIFIVNPHAGESDNAAVIRNAVFGNADIKLDTLAAVVYRSLKRADGVFRRILHKPPVCEPHGSAVGFGIVHDQDSLYYRVVVFIDPLQGLCYNAEDAVDWCVAPTA